MAINTNHKITSYKTLIAVTSGHIVERYDVIISGFFAVIFSSIFFPTSSASLSTFFSFASFASGFLMRPLGGVVFGHFGDRIGRRAPFINSIILVTIPTFTIGILPTYEQAGISVSIIFIICRLLQGFSIGGEYSGAIIYFFENITKNKKGLGGSLICATGFIGGVIGLLLSTLCSLPFMPSWSWRIPFMLGSILGIVSYVYRLKILETPIFQNIKNHQLTIQYPLFRIIKKQKRNAFCASIIGAHVHVLLNTATISLPSILLTTLNMPAFKVAALNTIIWFLWAIIIVVVGYVSDKVEKRKIMLWSSMISLSIIYPIFMCMGENSVFYAIICFQLIITLMGATYFAVTPSFLPSLFLPQERYTGLAFSINMGQAFIGSLAPLLISLLVSWVGIFKAVALVLIGSNIMGYFAVSKAKVIASSFER